MYICVMPTGFGNNRYMTYDFRLRFHVPIDTKYVISETLFPAKSRG